MFISPHKTLTRHSDAVQATPSISRLVPGGDAKSQDRKHDQMSMISSLFRRSERRKTYADLLQLDDHLLRDIGLSRGDVRQMMNGRVAPSRANAHE
jgi:uncharacterized protein YjiS (DUF1127 family)